MPQGTHLEIEVPDSDRFRRPEYAACNPCKGQRPRAGPGANLGFKDIDSSFLELVGTKVTEHGVAVERHETKQEYLHPVAGSTAKIGAGLFLKPTR